MTSAARSVFVFGVYLGLLGATLMIAPNLLLTIFGFPPPDEPWIRVAGLLAALIGYYYVQCARSGLRRFLELTVGARLAVPVVFAALVVLGLAKPALLLFGIADLAGAIWTLVALRADSMIVAPTIGR